MSAASVKTKKSKSEKPQQARSFSPVRHLARPDEWALGMGLKVDGRQFSLRGREYVQQVIRDTSQEIVIPKAAQMAFTVTFITRSLHWIKERKWHHLYLLPLKTGAIPFVQSRIDPVINSNSALDDHFTTVDNRLHKQTIENINLYIRGTNIVNELQEIPVDVEVWDERDRMVEDNLEDARHRMDGSNVKKLTILSTPTVPGHGVDAEDAWWASDMHRWEIPCPKCSRFQVLSFDDHLKLGDTADECAIECQFCHKQISDLERAEANAFGRWVPSNLNGTIRGYHISQFNSPTQPLVSIVKGWFAGQRDARKLKAFHNQSLGVPYTAAGDQITAQILDNCVIPGHSLGGIPDGAVYVGIDVGNLIHVKASTLTRNGSRRTYAMKIFREWGELEKFLDSLTTWVGVIDAHPEKRAARDLSIKYGGKLWLGFELDRPQTQEIAVWHPIKHKEATKVAIDRTMAFDSVIKQYMDGGVILPGNAREIGEFLPNKDYNGFYAQMMQQVRVEREDTQGRLRAFWQKNKNPDHWHHADMFEFIACLRKPGLEVPTQISEAFGKASLVGA